MRSRCCRLSTSHSFELAAVARYLHSATVRDVLIQAMLDAPMFAARWRWVAGTSLALPRFRGGKKVPAPLQRMRADDLMAAVFPDQIACAENIVGPRAIPDHPLVEQTVHDCLHEAMDIEGLERLLRAIEAGAVAIVACDLALPSPLALEILTARPYAYLDDAPLEERRTQAVMARRWMDDASAQRLGRLDIAAIERVRAEKPRGLKRTPQMELHDALLALGVPRGEEADAHAAWLPLLQALADQRRVTCLHVRGAPGEGRPGESGVHRLWVAAERLPLLQGVFDNAVAHPPIAVPAEFARQVFTREAGLVEIVRSRLGGVGPVTLEAFAESLGLAHAEVEAALTALAAEGVAMRGLFTPGTLQHEWCDRALLARIHRYTVSQLRQEIEPVSTQVFMRFLFRWQHIVADDRRQGPDALEAVIAELQGFEAPAAAWEAELLPARLADYEFTWLDDLCLAGRVVWTRLTLPGSAQPKAHPGPLRTTSIALLPRRFAPLWNRAVTPPSDLPPKQSSRAQAVSDFLRDHGAAFYDEIVEGTGLLRTQTEEALAELVALGVASSDSFAGLRALLTPSEKRKPLGGRGRRRAAIDIADSGRWALQKRRAAPPQREPRASGGCAATHARAHRAYPAPALWRRILAPPATRGVVVAAMARSAARPATTGSAWRNPRRALRRRHFG